MLSEEEVQKYFRAVEAGGSGSRRHELGLLTSAEASDLTRKFGGHPVIEQLDGLLLDDPNTSNHHVLLRRPPVSGLIMYLAHDDNSRMVFSSLRELLASAEHAQLREIALPELHPITAVLPTDQIALAALIRSLVAGEQVDVALTLIPSLDLADQSLLTDLVTHHDFFLGEAVGDAILARPSHALLPVAMQCALHQHPQVARVGRLAREACAK